MANNKVVYAGTTLIDLTGDTVTEGTLLEGYTAHDAAGNAITGKATAGSQVAAGTFTLSTKIKGDSMDVITISGLGFTPKRVSVYVRSLSRLISSAGCLVVGVGNNQGVKSNIIAVASGQYNSYLYAYDNSNTYADITLLDDGFTVSTTSVNNNTVPEFCNGTYDYYAIG